MTERKENAEHCVSCGEVIPEGQQVCPICLTSVPINHCEYCGAIMKGVK